MFLFYIVGLPILLIAGTILLTLVVEYPIVYYSGITRSRKYIVAVNALTNVCLNAGTLIVFLLNISKNSARITHAINIWIFFAELLWIPLAESVLYFKISKQSSTRVLLVTYAANFASFLIGLFVVGVFTDKNLHGIRSFFSSVFGGGLIWQNMYY